MASAFSMSCTGSPRRWPTPAHAYPDLSELAGCNEIVNVLNGAAEVLRGFLARKSKTGKFGSVGHSCHRALVARLRGATGFAVDCGFVNPPLVLARRYPCTA